MNKSAITILNVNGMPVTIPVEDLSDKSIKEALRQTLSVDVENIELLTTEQSTAVYGIKEIYPSVKDKLTSVNPYFAMHPNPYAHMVRVLFTNLL